MDKSYFEKYIMYDIDNGIRKHHYRISPLVEQRIKERLHTLLSEVEDKRIIFGAGCSLPLDIAAENIGFLRKAVDSTAL